MLLIVSNTEDATTNYLADVLWRSGVEHLRFDTDSILDLCKFRYEIGNPRLELNGKRHSPGDFGNVWYRRPERLKRSGTDDSVEAKLALGEWAEALEAFLSHIPAASWMNHPSANVAASHKLEQLTTAARIGLVPPRTLVTQDPSELRDFYHRLAGRMIVKPMSTGYLERPGQDADTLIYTNSVEKHHLADLTDLLNCPTLFQERVSKASDVRITAVDGRIHAVELIALDNDGKQRCDIRRDNMSDVTYRSIALPEKVERDIRTLLYHYTLRFAAIDMAVTTSGEWIFFEVNPNGQWAWMDLAGVTDIAGSFIKSFAEKDR